MKQKKTDRHKVILAEDHPDVRDLLRQELEEAGVEVVAAVSNGNELIEVCERIGPEKIAFVVADVSMEPGKYGGIEASRYLWETWLIASIICTVHNEPALIEKWFSENEHLIGYIPKDDHTPAQFRAAVAIGRQTYTMRDRYRRIFDSAIKIASHYHSNIDDGYRRLRTYAQNKRMNMVKAAAQIAEIFNDLDSACGARKQ